jgi:hypothetical protein
MDVPIAWTSADVLAFVNARFAFDMRQLYGQCRRRLSDSHARVTLVLHPSERRLRDVLLAIDADSRRMLFIRSGRKRAGAFVSVHAPSSEVMMAAAEEALCASGSLRSIRVEVPASCSRNNVCHCIRAVGSLSGVTVSRLRIDGAKRLVVDLDAARSGFKARRAFVLSMWKLDPTQMKDWPEEVQTVNTVNSMLQNGQRPLEDDHRRAGIVVAPHSRDKAISIVSCALRA